MTWVRLLIYTDTPERLAETQGRSLPDGIRSWSKGGSSIRVITLKRPGWFRSVWKSFSQNPVMDWPTYRRPWEEE